MTAPNGPEAFVHEGWPIEAGPDLVYRPDGRRVVSGCDDGAAAFVQVPRASGGACSLTRCDASQILSRIVMPPVHDARTTAIAAARGLAKALVRFVLARWKLLLLLFLGVGVPLVAFGGLAEDVYSRGGIGWDEPILRWVHGHATPRWDAVMVFISAIGHLYGVVPAAVLILVLLLVRRSRGNAIFWAVAVAGAGVLNTGAKLFFRRTRPDLWESVAPEHTYSFPSGHAMGSMAFAAALAVLAWPTRWRWWAIALGGVFTLLVGFSRVYLGVHFPSDVVAGWSASLAWVLGLSLVAYGRLAKPRSRSTPAAAGPDPAAPAGG